MENNYYENYVKITGEDTRFQKYRTPEEEANKIKRCTLLESIDIAYGNKVEGYQDKNNYYVSV